MGAKGSSAKFHGGRGGAAVPPTAQERQWVTRRPKKSSVCPENGVATPWGVTRGLRPPFTMRGRRVEHRQPALSSRASGAGFQKAKRLRPQELRPLPQAGLPGVVRAAGTLARAESDIEGSQHFLGHRDPRVTLPAIRPAKGLRLAQRPARRDATSCSRCSTPKSKTASPIRATPSRRPSDVIAALPPGGARAG